MDPLLAHLEAAIYRWCHVPPPYGPVFPVADRIFRHAEYLRNISLVKTQVEPFGSETVSQRIKTLRIARRLRFFGPNRKLTKRQRWGADS